VREAFWEQERKALPAQPSPDEKLKWELEHPLGWVEHRFQFSPNGTYGKWLRTKNAAVKINDSLFLHGGISEKYAAMTVAQLNAAVRAELDDVLTIDPANSTVTDTDGPLWYRGLARDDGADARALALRLTETHGVKRIVIGHTPTPGAVLPRFGGSVVAADVGLSAYYGSGRACLVIERDKPYALHRGRMIELPAGEPADDLAYLKKVAALEKPDSPLARFTAQLEAQAGVAR
jgi:hypothetical protein